MEKKCSTCKYEYRSGHEDPCNDCWSVHEFNKWEAKEDDDKV